MNFRLDKKDRRVVAAASLALMALTSVPMIVALAVARARGLEWSGRIHLSPGDLAVYLSDIAQAARGRFLFSDLASTAPLLPTPNPVWSAAGVLVAAFGLSPLAAYQALRLLLIPVLALVSWTALGHFVRDRMSRVAAYAILLFGSGFGAVVAPLLGAPAYRGGDYPWPTDLWVGESNVFLSALYSPHFLASWTLLIAALWLLSVAYEEGRLAPAAWAGAAALALFSFHPFYAASLYVVAAAWGVMAVVRRRRVRAIVATSAVFIAVSVPAAAWYLWLARYTPNGAFMIGSNLLWSPNPVYVALGFGGALLLAPLGRLAAKGDAARRADELVAWAVATVVLAYAGFTFERRLLEGLAFPLAALSGITVAAGIRAFAAVKGIGRHFAVAAGSFAVAAVFLPSTFYAIVVPSLLFTEPEPRAMFFFPPDESAALAWLRAYAPADATVLSTADAGNDILGWSGRRTYAGHWAATPDIDRRLAEVRAFYGPATSDARRSFLSANGIGYVYAGPDERALGGDLDADPGLEKVFSQGDRAIYQVKP